MMKMIVDMDVYDEKSKMKILKSVAGLPGIHIPYMDLKEGTLTVTGDIDPVWIVMKLRKKWRKADLTLFVPYDEAKENREVRECEALYRSNRDIRNLHHVRTSRFNSVSDQEQCRCVIC